jgi:Cd2+/Zn2+-exporting ATPase
MAPKATTNSNTNLSVVRNTFRITGMCCVTEATALQKQLEPLTGLQDVEFNLLQGTISVAYDEEKVSAQDIMRAAERAGLKAEIVTPRQEGDPAPPAQEPSPSPHRMPTMLSAAALAGGVAAQAMLAGPGSLLEGAETAPLFAQLLYLSSAVAGLWRVAPKAWSAARRLRPDMNLLMTIAVIGAIGIGEWIEAATVAFLFALSLMLESWSVGRARRAVAALMELSPDKARVVDDQGREREVSPRDVAVGSHIVVRPGERIPLDGRIAAGASHVNQAPITGESVPVEKAVGDEVFAGTINGDGALDITTTKPASETTLARIISLVSDAQSRRAPVEQWVDKFARLYTPLVVGLAVLIAVVPPLLFDGAWSAWFYQALVLLVIACPCALVISTPVSIVCGLARAARAGVLIKGGVYLELPANIRAFAFDKTGTLTEGHPKVEKVITLAGQDEEELLRLAASVEARSEHLLGRAIVEAAEERQLPLMPISDFHALQGRGAEALVDGERVWVSSPRHLAERLPTRKEEIGQEITRLQQEGSTVVALGRGEEVLGLIALVDRVREDSRAALADLHAAGVKTTVLLTGDNTATARRIANSIGIDDVRAELLPEHKVDAVEELLQQHGQVAMIGDGINDAPALARASLGIAMGAAGTDAALETADIALMSDDLSRLPWLVRHSRRTLAIIHQNIAFSLVIKAVFVVLAFFGVATLWAAIAADMGTSLLVTLNAMRLLANRDGR